MNKSLSSDEIRV